MSASEKLKALWPKWSASTSPGEGYEAIYPLGLALQELIAVVEAAEFARDNPWMPGDVRWEDFDQALAKLDAKLDR